MGLRGQLLGRGGGRATGRQGARWLIGGAMTGSGPLVGGMGKRGRGHGHALMGGACQAVMQSGGEGVGEVCGADA